MNYCNLTCCIALTDYLSYVYFAFTLFFLIPFSLFIVFQLFQVVKIDVYLWKAKNNKTLYPSDYLFDLVTVLLKKRLWFDAIKLLESAQNLSELEKPQYFNALGFVYYSVHKYNIAKFYYLKALKLKKNYIVALQNLAKLYDIAKNYEMAASTYQTVLTYDPLNKVAKKSLRALGRFSKDY